MDGIVIATVNDELPEFTTLDLSDLWTTEERESEIARRDADAELNFAEQGRRVLLTEWYNERFSEPTEPAWIREAAEIPYP